MLTPTLHLTNWASRSQHGPGRRICAMARPRRWEHGDGRCSLLSPLRFWLDDWHSGDLTTMEYRARCETRFAGALMDGLLQPGALLMDDQGDDYEGIGPHPARRLIDGDTVLCSCARPGSPRRSHECHLEWLAPYLVRAGWGVVLYGEQL